MTVTTRIKAVKGAFSPRQIALLEIEDMRRFPNHTACLVAIMDGQVCKGGTYVDRVLESVKRAHKGAKPETIRRLQQEGIREAMFLIALAGECTRELEQSREAIGMQRRFVHALAMVVYLTAEAKTEWFDRMPDACEEAENYLWRVRSLRDAVRLIEREYFGGRPILFADTEAWLADEVACAESLADLYNTCANLSMGVEPPGSACDRARKHAVEWVAYTRAEVHERMGERNDAASLLRPMLHHRDVPMAGQSRDDNPHMKPRRD